MTTKEGLQYITGQIVDILKQIDNPALTQPLTIFNGSTMGQHFRHIFDFYNCILLGIESGEIDYTKRERNSAIEQDQSHSISAFRAVLTSLMKLDPEFTIRVKTDFSKDEQIRDEVLSSIGREMMYAHDHALHHLAIIKIGLNSNFPHIRLSKEVGVAPSTLKHMDQQQKQKRGTSA